VSKVQGSAVIAAGFRSLATGCSLLIKIILPEASDKRPGAHNPLNVDPLNLTPDLFEGAIGNYRACGGRGENRL
ncbi:MAG: hypothetical protein PVJ54_11375, partial [Desulfobacterales bacterium]